MYHESHEKLSILPCTGCWWTCYNLFLDHTADLGLSDDFRGITSVPSLHKGPL